jgi:hypothetical protein
MVNAIVQMPPEWPDADAERLAQRLREAARFMRWIADHPKLADWPTVRRAANDFEADSEPSHNLK